MKYLFFLAFVLNLSSCEWNKPHNSSIIIIAVDSLTLEDINCMQLDNISGFNTICQEFIKFTHAYTPSTLVNPALTSVLTGLYPIDHKVRDNSFQDISPNAKSIAMYASQNHFRTSFYSGGAPVLRASQLHKGFEVFDDNINPTINTLFRNFEMSIKLFKNWFEQDKKNSFFTVFYVPDINFPQNPTRSETGEVRSNTTESQIKELDENLNNLFSFLKQNQAWKKSHIFLIGLNGRTNIPRKDELPSYNLQSETSKVALFYKIPSKDSAETTQNWSIHKAVTLADVGKTLFDILKAPENPEAHSHFKTTSLNQFIYLNQNFKRPLLIESGWPKWHNLSEIRTAFFIEPYLFINDEDPKIYNTLVDKLELYPLLMTDLRDSAIKNQFIQILQSEPELKPWPPIKDTVYKKIKISNELFNSSNYEEFLLKNQSQFKKEIDSSIKSSLISTLIKINDDSLFFKYEKLLNWDELKEVNQKKKNKNYEFTNHCLKLTIAKNYSTPNIKKCNDEPLLLFLSWHFDKKDSSFLNFMSEYRFLKVSEFTQLTNQTLNLVWNIPIRTQNTNLVDLVMTLPEFIESKNRVAHSL